MTIKTNEDVIKEWFVNYFESYIIKHNSKGVFNKAIYNKLINLMMKGLIPFVDCDDYVHN